MIALFSYGGQLFSLFATDQDLDGVERVNNYQELELGKPMVVRYLSFFLNNNKLDGNNQIMISTFVKTEETKSAASEAINLYDEKLPAVKDKIYISEFGAHRYGHELVYYTKSYTGESLKLTIRARELSENKKEISTAIDTIAGVAESIPVFLPYIPYVTAVKTVGKVIDSIRGVFIKDYNIFKDNPLDLHFNRVNCRLLRSGRIVCFPDLDSEEEKDKIMNDYHLSINNKVTKKNSKTDFYEESSYFVLQINREKKISYEHFEHFLQAADLLAKLNGPSPQTVIKSLAESSFQAVNDINILRQLQDLKGDSTTTGLAERNALYRHLSPDMQIRCEYLLPQKTP